MTSQSSVKAVYVEGADGTKYFPRFDSYDSATNQATFVMLDALPNGDYELHLSGAAGLADLGGNELVGNDPSCGDYVVPFTVDAPARGTAGNPLEWNDQEPNDNINDPQDLGVPLPERARGRGHHHARLQPGSQPGPAGYGGRLRIPGPSRSALHLHALGQKTCPPGSR